MKIHNLVQPQAGKTQQLSNCYTHSIFRQHLASKTTKPMNTNKLHQTPWNKTQKNRHHSGYKRNNWLQHYNTLNTTPAIFNLFTMQVL